MRDAARMGDFRRHLGTWQHAAVAGLGALRQFDFDHLHLRQGGLRREFFGRKRAVVVAAAEVAGGDLPDQIAARLVVIFGTVIAADAAFAGIVHEAAELRAAIERADCIA